MNLCSEEVHCQSGRSERLTITENCEFERIWRRKESGRHQAFYSLGVTALPHAAKAVTSLNILALPFKYDWLCGL